MVEGSRCRLRAGDVDESVELVGADRAGDATDDVAVGVDGDPQRERGEPVRSGQAVLSVVEQNRCGPTLSGEPRGRRIVLTVGLRRRGHGDDADVVGQPDIVEMVGEFGDLVLTCLLYTSDAADERG